MRRVAFVGIRRKYKELDPSYIGKFDQYHLEIPFYYAMYGNLDVVTTTVDLGANETHDDFFVRDGETRGSHTHMTEQEFVNDKTHFDAVVHWREWFPELYKSDTLNLLHTCDFGYSEEWKKRVIDAHSSGKLYGVDCYPTWHKGNLFKELNELIPNERLLEGHTLGVDTEIYKPSFAKSPYHMLWSSDPGRGLQGALQLVLKLFQIDKRFRLHVCWPDYVKNVSLPLHPAIISHGCMKNGPELWNLFNMCGILPYTSTFPEPSSRAHRQAMAAGSLVLYPPNMGSPSELIENGRTGIVEPISQWPEIIIKMVQDGSWSVVGSAARAYAISENWEVQAKRFSTLIEKIIQEKKTND